jgi:hypothetical protein
MRAITSISSELTQYPGAAELVQVAHGARRKPGCVALDAPVALPMLRAIPYLAEGLGHASQALNDDATVVYLCSEVDNPTGEHGITPPNPQVGLGLGDLEPLLSPKDTAAPTLAEAEAEPEAEPCPPAPPGTHTEHSATGNWVGPAGPSGLHLSAEITPWTSLR